MIRIAVTPIAYDAIASTLPLGSVGLRGRARREGPALGLGRGGSPRAAQTMRRPGESYCDVILRLVEIEAKRRR